MYMVSSCRNARMLQLTLQLAAAGCAIVAHPATAVGSTADMVRFYELSEWRVTETKLRRANQRCARNPAQQSGEDYDPRAVKNQMAHCGFVVLKDVFPRDMIAGLEKLASRQFHDTAQDNRTKHDRAGFVKRSAKRFEMSLNLSTFVNPQLLYNPAVLQTVENTLGESMNYVELETLSSVTSLPGAPAQHWHYDFGRLFGTRDLNVAVDTKIPQHQPAHAVVVFIPLVDVPAEMGPTEIATGSHIECHSSLKTKRELGPGSTYEIPKWSKIVRPAMAAGDVILLDLRVLHRGGPNKSMRERPMLYLQYAHEWFVDSVNFDGRQTRELDGLPKAARKLVRRLDARRYVEGLEAKLREAGVDVGTLRSQTSDVAGVMEIDDDDGLGSLQDRDPGQRKHTAGRSEGISVNINDL